MITRTTLGSPGLTVSAMGLGCMGMSESYGAADWDGGLAAIDRALELGVTFLDTADAYGTGHNEVLVGRAVHGRRERVQLATEFGIDRSAGDRARRIRGARDYVLRACDASLLRLGAWTCPPPTPSSGRSTYRGRYGQGDVVRGPYAQAAGAPIHPADFAGIAVAALTDDAHAGRTYPVTGPQSLTHAEQIALLAEALDRPLRYEELPVEQARTAMGPPTSCSTTGPATSTARHRSPTPSKGSPADRAAPMPQWAKDYRGDFLN
ncbi:aldo/keto reductase [Amycolatopsis umgeniensis]|uniref:NADP-dependent oxidoreductase domain-containing protein n=1 Tax=Amycolatopsis umgeniensis TaxID=336628 RepID=A0A841BCP4_9PSEU|nr:aldo/keto reductase [Amycolatopsis umgeniensis]MBB5856488.1 hypothetical protein [Amycolatopsis umgeniensis]